MKVARMFLDSSFDRTFIAGCTPKGKVKTTHRDCIAVQFVPIQDARGQSLSPPASPSTSPSRLDLLCRLQQVLNSKPARLPLCPLISHNLVLKQHQLDLAVRSRVMLCMFPVVHGVRRQRWDEGSCEGGKGQLRGLSIHLFHRSHFTGFQRAPPPSGSAHHLAPPDARNESQQPDPNIIIIVCADSVPLFLSHRQVPHTEPLVSSVEKHCLPLHKFQFLVWCDGSVSPV